VASGRVVVVDDEFDRPDEFDDEPPSSADEPGEPGYNSVLGCGGGDEAAGVNGLKNDDVILPRKIREFF